MAEEEIAKHTKAIYKSLKNKEETWAHRLKEIAIEVLIIVFAVSISIWFHNWSDSLHEKKDEKAFLIGLKKDLNGDLVNLHTSLQFYKFVLGGTAYFLKVGSGQPVNKDSVNQYANIFFSSTDLEPHSSRYEALKGSNKFTIIENPDLLNDIISLHESSFTRVITLDHYYHDDISTKMVPFISSHVQVAPNGSISNTQELAKNPQMRILLMTMQGYITGNLIAAHNNAITTCNTIIKEIDKELE